MIPNQEILQETEQRLKKIEPLPPPAFLDVPPPEEPVKDRRPGREPRIQPSFTPSLRAPATGREVSPSRAAHLRFAGAEPSLTEHERIMGTNDLVDEFYLQRALVAARPVCRVVLRTPSGREYAYATGFMVAPRLLLTNWHVFKKAEEAQNAVAEFGYTLDIAGNPCVSTRFLVQPDAFFHSDRKLDCCVVAVDTESIGDKVELALFGYHRLVQQKNKVEDGEWITIIQHPGGSRRQYAIRENRLQSRDDRALWYFSDTAQGSSGAPVFNDSFQVVALHHSGVANRDGDKYVLKDGTLVDSIADIDESAIDWKKNEGIRISRVCNHLIESIPAGDAYTQELLAAMEEGDIMSRALISRDLPVIPVRPEHRPDAGSFLFPTGDGRPAPATVVINAAQIHIDQLTVEAPRPPAPVVKPVAPQVQPEPDDAVGIEKYVQPIIDTHYSNRDGYRENFLGRKKELKVPLPKVTQKDLVAKMSDGECIIPYEHYSVVLNRKRRLALFTAANVDGRPQYREPEPGDYTRKGLSGLKDGEIEGWATDPRIGTQDQLPDVFYIKDKKAFDRGHLVRRDDVCWGRTRNQVVRANGDSFHVTNCSPQVADFNRSQYYGWWGQLENYVLDQAEAEAEEQKLCVFAGPVLDPEDGWFDGRDDSGPVRVQIPRVFWKVVVARDGDNLQAFAFLLEQDLSKVDLVEDEGFTVNAEWRPCLVSIPELETWIDGFEFPKAIHDADQYDEQFGHELAKARSIPRETLRSPPSGSSSGETGSSV